MRIAVVEDEKKLASLIRTALLGEGFQVDNVPDGSAALEMIQNTSFDAVILDIMLPGRDGLSILRQLRNESNDVPVLVLTARNQVSEKVEGLKLGADDYLTKPFYIDELVARMHALVRRRSGESVTRYQIGDLLVDLTRHRVTRSGLKIELTAREFALLEMLAKHPGKVFTRSHICERVWEYHFDPGTNLVDVYIQRLRKKIDANFEPKLLYTIRNVGYCLAEKAP